MGLRIVYKDGKDFACSLTQAKKLVSEEGWSWTPSGSEPTASAKPRKAKVKVETEEIEVDSPFNDGEPINIDLGKTIENTEESDSSDDN